ncbi:hypothetical protein LCGC14_0730040 [marine sediment metagenome]|uniref:Uncharacterized protein n=1 Tax=marine sediment metagenome TaxID=412755 RepID=A0A0F9TH73_9ZZZZ
MDLQDIIVTIIGSLVIVLLTITIGFLIAGVVLK